MQRSPNFRDGAFRNPEPTSMALRGGTGNMLKRWFFGREQAVDAHARLRGVVLLPIHWGTFNLAYHAWDEPAERVIASAVARGTRLVVPRPGESIEPANAPAVRPWWRQVLDR